MLMQMIADTYEDVRQVWDTNKQCIREEGDGVRIPILVLQRMILINLLIALDLWSKLSTTRKSLHLNRNALAYKFLLLESRRVPCILALFGASCSASKNSFPCR